MARHFINRNGTRNSDPDPSPGTAAAPVVTGSHCDAIPLAGAYDGTLGVIGAIAAVKGLNASGFVPRRSIEVLMFTSEEPTRFGLGCIGRCPDFDFESILNPRFWSRPIIPIP